MSLPAYYKLADVKALMAELGLKAEKNSFLKDPVPDRTWTFLLCGEPGKDERFFLSFHNNEYTRILIDDMPRDDMYNDLLLLDYLSEHKAVDVYGEGGVACYSIDSEDPIADCPIYQDQADEQDRHLVFGHNSHYRCYEYGYCSLGDLTKAIEGSWKTTETDSEDESDELKGFEFDYSFLNISDSRSHFNRNDRPVRVTLQQTIENMKDRDIEV
ncbi:MAG: hypothetical protein WCO55_04365 [Candidatus Falkowbacteria bacterium]